MDYSKLIKDLTAEMKKGKTYKALPIALRIIFIILFIPLILSFLLSKLIFWFTIFFYKMLAAPAEHLHKWLTSQKDDVQHLTQAVMYIVCLPVIFGFQVALSFNAIAFFFQWFGIQIVAYILTLGGTRWQPFITEATFDQE